MPRKARNDKLDTRTARAKLKPRPEPYWFTIQEGRAIGYRRAAGGKAGSWVARHYSPDGGRHYQALGSADDTLDPDGGSTLTFGQAQDAALAWFREIERNAGRVKEPITVKQAIDAYMEDYRARGGKAEREMLSTITAHILPELGDKQVASLTNQKLRQWHQKVASAPARLRTSAKAKVANERRAETPGDKRARRSSANRILTVLKAALNFAYREGHVPSDDPWRRLKPFANVEAPRVRYLTDAEALRLANACGADFRALVSAALLTGARYGELTRLCGGDFDAENNLLHIRVAKGGKARTIPLTDEGARFFTKLAAGKAGKALLLTRDDGEAWGKSHQFRPLQEACQAANISPGIGFHGLRHTFATRLVQKGVPMSVVAAAIGDSEVIAARHYAHLSPNYIADAIRRGAGDMGIAPAAAGAGAVVPMRRVVPA